MPRTYRMFRKAFGRRAAQGTTVTAIFAINVFRFATTVSGLLFILTLDGWPIHGTVIAEAVGEIIVLLAIQLWIDLSARAWSHTAPERALSASAFALSPSLILFFPLTYPILKGSRLIVSNPSRIQLREELTSWLDELEIAGAIDRSSKQLLEAASTFHERLVREVMMPRSQIFALPATMPLKEATPELLREGYSRIPLYETSIDHITGILMAKDVLAYTTTERPRWDQAIGPLAKRPYYVPETKPIGQLLQELRRRHTHMAIVVDEYGYTAGIVTIEDLLEELVGEIADEYDTDEQPLIQPHPKGGWVVNARISITDLEDRLGIVVPQEPEYDTLAGYIVHRVGSIPRKGLTIHHELFDLQIVSSTDRSVELVRVIPRTGKEPE
jgi:CBS domain containing-hemolysin-like protein